MTIYFQLTRADYLEAAAGISDSQSRFKPSVWSLFVFPLVGVGMGFGLAWLSDATGLTPRELIVSTAIPGASLGVLALILNVAKYVRLRRRPSWVAIVGLASVILVGLELLLIGRYTPLLTQSSNSPSSTDWNLLFPHISWISVALIMICVVLMKQASRRRLYWTGQPSLQLPKTVDISAFGVSWSDAIMRMEYQWSAFVKFEESRNLFLLFTGPVNFLIIPKRAFVFPDEMKALRELAKLIDTRTPSGFPVGPPPSATPFAPIPLPPMIG